MSVKLMAQVWELELESTEKLVLLAMADFANDEGRCYPSLSRVAQKCGRSSRQAWRIFSALREKMLIVPVEQGGGRHATVYIVHPENGRKLPQFHPQKGEPDVSLRLN